MSGVSSKALVVGGAQQRSGRLFAFSLGLNALLLLWQLRRLLKEKGGFRKLLGSIVAGTLKVVPGASAALEKEMTKEVEKNLTQTFPESKEAKFVKIPPKGLPREELIATMKRIKEERDVQPHAGTCWAYVYATNPLRPEHEEVIREANNIFLHDNALNPAAFPSLRKFETEVVAMAASMLHGDSRTVGSLTSGGTESLLLAIKTYRDHAKATRPGGGPAEPEMVMPTTAHVALEKAAHYFGLKVVHVPIDPETLKPNMEAYRKAINKNTILLVGSAPQYPHGVVDPIEEIARLATIHNLPMHVDSCIGGFFLPWAEKLGYAIPKFDFRVPGVTSISADLHKYGYAPKGSSVLLFRTAELRRHQFYVYTEWPGGLYGSPTLLGTRGGGAIASAWASLVALGEEGFLQLAESVMQTSKKLQAGVNKINGLKILGKPDGSLVSFGSTEANVNIFTVADVMEKKFGWHMERQPNPDSIHLTVMPPHVQIADRFLEELALSVEEVRKAPQASREGSAALYGLVAKIPDSSITDKFINLWLDKIYQA